MKKKMIQQLVKAAFFIMLLAAPLSLVAQDDEDPGTGFEDGGSVEDDLSMPIDNQIFWLAAAGVGLMYYFNKKRVRQGD